MEAGILVLDEDEEIFRVVRELIGELCPVAYATDIDSALAMLQKQEIAVVVTDIEFGQEQLTDLAAQQENPRSCHRGCGASVELVIDSQQA
jgi:DNA-binding NtrC family response regulator